MELLSIQFFLLCLAAITILPALRGTARWVAFLVLNVWFVWSYVGPEGFVVVGVLCLLGYAFACWARTGGRVATITGIATLTLAFVFVRRYSLLELAVPESWFLNMAVPAGLSFLFFKIIHVVVDSSGDACKELRPTTYANYCLNFTSFLMGPIQRYQDFEEQWSSGHSSNQPNRFEDYVDAMNRVLLGLVKKFVLAEFLRRVSMHSGMDMSSMSAGELLVRLYAFYLCLYCDFSGYCDVVIGVGSMMGVRPPENFNLPFLARNVSEYWLRVHRSLTLWLTDYVFTPCYAATLRNRFFRGRTLLALAISLMVTMFVSGLWHGTTLSFLCFGVVHGVFLVVQRVYERYMTKALGRQRFAQWSKHPIVHVVAVVLTYNVTSLAYVFFVLDLRQVVQVVSRLVFS